MDEKHHQPSKRKRRKMKFLWY